jgi:phosphatidate cytidylyltransferase
VGHGSRARYFIFARNRCHPSGIRDRIVHVSAIFCGTLLWWITPFTPIQAFGFAAIIVIFGFTGGLILSAVKRSLGAKDWGSSIAGHGSALDRLDSLSFSAPIFFHLVRCFFSV